MRIKRGSKQETKKENDVRHAMLKLSGWRIPAHLIPEGEQRACLESFILSAQEEAPYPTDKLRLQGATDAEVIQSAAAIVEAFRETVRKREPA